MADKKPERLGRPSLGGAGGVSPVLQVRMSEAAREAARVRAVAERRTVPDLVRRAVRHYLATPEDEGED